MCGARLGCRHVDLSHRLPSPPPLRGRYDAGDTLKLNFPMATSVSYLAWSILEFPRGYERTGSMTAALNNVRLAADYLLRCHKSTHTYVGMIGNPGSDHSFWGRPEDTTAERPAYTYTRDTPASDLLGVVSAALASSSLVLQASDAAYAARLLASAETLYAWGRAVEGRYSDSYRDVTYVYSSSRYLDKLMYAAAWLHRATGSAAYADDAYALWKRFDADVYVGWDSASAPAVNLLLAARARGAAVPGADEYEGWWRDTFAKSWTDANGNWSLVRTPGGLIYPSWSKWGNLRHASNAAFQFVLRAAYADKAASMQWAQAQLDYALWSTGRSFVVGVGNSPPQQPHHRAASCPTRPEPCLWDHFTSRAPNPQTLYGALVGGPPDGDGTYVDARDDYVSNEVAVDYNAGFTGALAGMLAMS